MFFPRLKKEFSYSSFIKRAKRFDPFELQKYDELVPYLKSIKKQAVPRKLGLKLIVISDTHGYFAFDKTRLPEYMSKIDEYDLCVLLGDIHRYDLEQIVEIIPKEKILALRGNHDSYELYERVGIKEMSARTVTYKGVTFAGIEGSFRYKNGIYPSFTQYESLYQFEELQPADVLLSHDGMFENSKNDIAHAGLAGITKYIYEYSPVMHIHGHLHQSYSRVYDNGTVEKCVYLFEHFEI